MDEEHAGEGVHESKSAMDRAVTMLGFGRFAARTSLARAAHKEGHLGHVLVLGKNRRQMGKRSRGTFGRKFLLKFI